MNETTGTWSTDDRHAYFLAGDGRPSRTGDPHKFVLIAVNELCNGSGLVKPKQRARVDALIENNVRVFVDSGIFWLTNEHKRAHGISMDEALALRPDQIDGFDWLWRSYLEVHRTWGDKVWGYIELDQGGADNKRITRGKLNDLGIYPLPVYHPLNDGWDYFDEIASTHDRMCCGNVVQAAAPLRVRLLHTIAERHRAYPALWLHFLGFTPNQWVNAFPVDSCDSSTWLDTVRWSPAKDAVMSRAFKSLGPEFMYRLGSSEFDHDGSAKATMMSACGVVFHNRGWRHWQKRVEAELGLPDYPPTADDQSVLLTR